MKKVLLTIIILSIAVTSVFGLVACNQDVPPTVNTQITDPNEFIKQLKETTEFTLHGFDDKGNEIGKISRNGNGEFMFIEGVDEAYVIKENNVLTLYTKTAGEWTKETDASKVEEMLNSFTQAELVAQLNEVGALTQNDDGYWYGAGDIEKKAGFKMEDGMFVGYIKINETWLKSSAIELKADIKLPEEAKNAGENTQITDPNEFVKLMKNAKEVTAYSYDMEGNVNRKTIINKEGEIADIVGDRERYIIKENDKFVAYIKEAGGWTKEIDKTVIEEMKKRYAIETLIEQLEGLGTLVNNDDGYWYTPSDTGYYFGVKIINGKWITYARYDNEMIKSATVELKAEDIILPDEAKDAIDNTQISDPNEFVKQAQDAKELTVYYYGDNGEELGKCSLNSEGEVVLIMDDEIHKECMYIVKENNKFVAYIKEGNVWTKETDELKIEELKKNYTVATFAKQLEQLGVLEKSINGYWYAEIDTGHSAPVKMVDGKLIGYKEIQNGVFIKATTIELKADIILPEEAKNASN